MQIPQTTPHRLAPTVRSQPRSICSVTIATSPRCAVFADCDLGLACVDILGALRSVTGTRVFAYCLMPEYALLLLGAGVATPLDRFIQSWKSFCYLERKRRGPGPIVWQRGYLDRTVGTGTDLRAAALSIVHGPVRAKLVREWREYRLSGSFELEL